jgi:hypothetical protein
MAMQLSNQEIKEWIEREVGVSLGDGEIEITDLENGIVKNFRIFHFQTFLLSHQCK